MPLEVKIPFEGHLEIVIYYISDNQEYNLVLH